MKGRAGERVLSLPAANEHAHRSSPWPRPHNTSPAKRPGVHLAAQAGGHLIQRLIPGHRAHHAIAGHQQGLRATQRRLIGLGKWWASEPAHIAKHASHRQLQLVQALAATLAQQSAAACLHCEQHQLLRSRHHQLLCPDG